MAFAGPLEQAGFRWRPAGQHSSHLVLQVSRQTVRPPSAGRRFAGGRGEQAGRAQPPEPDLGPGSTRAAVARPAAKLRPDPRPRPERRRKVAPLAARLCDVQHRVRDGAEVMGLLAALARRVEHRFQQFPLLIGQVTWVRHVPHGDRGNRPCDRNTPSQGSRRADARGPGRREAEPTEWLAIVEACRAPWSRP
jgi:hypothetical protein